MDDASGADRDSRASEADRDSRTSEADRDYDAWARAVMDGYEGVAEAYDARRDPGEELALVDDLVAECPPGARVLDAGCGAGRAVLEHLPDGFDAVGLDVSAAQLALARDRVPAAALARGDISRLPFADDAFDAVCSLHAIIHVPREHHERVFAEFARVVEPGGQLLVAVGNGAWEGDNDDWLDSGAAMRWSFHGSERNRALVRGDGFRIDDATVVSDGLDDGEWLFLRATLED